MTSLNVYNQGGGNVGQFEVGSDIFETASKSRRATSGSSHATCK